MLTLFASNLNILMLNFHFIFLCRPLIVVGGSCDADQEAMGGFQEYPQVIFVKYSGFFYFTKDTLPY